ncbi:hypothetical protein GGR52DRAFT_405892 [Hypoxylon sp. FL1284]|nr:hypothetical protein GGR52DRAFT_405892 [Hypoxylon sp. FL1284]
MGVDGKDTGVRPGQFPVSPAVGGPGVCLGDIFYKVTGYRAPSHQSLVTKVMRAHQEGASPCSRQGAHRGASRYWRRRALSERRYRPEMCQPPLTSTVVREDFQQHSEIDPQESEGGPQGNKQGQAQTEELTPEQVQERYEKEDKAYTAYPRTHDAMLQFDEYMRATIRPGIHQPLIMQCLILEDITLQRRMRLLEEHMAPPPYSVDTILQLNTERKGGKGRSKRRKGKKSTQ